MNRSLKFMEAIDAYDCGDKPLALHLMEECAKSGEAAACFTMALWFSGTEDMPRDNMRSAQWLAAFKQLAEDGNLEAQWDLGQNYRFGNLLPQDVDLANRWLQRAAAGGYGEAQHHLAWYYEFGQYGYPIDKAEAEGWYRRALDQEHPETLYLFALREFKDGKPTDAALALLRKAADKGFAQAEHILRAVTH